MAEFARQERLAREVIEGFVHVLVSQEVADVLEEWRRLRIRVARSGKHSGGLVELKDMVGRRVGDGAPPSVAPGHFNGQTIGCAPGGKRPHEIIAGKITPATDDFLALRRQARRQHADLRTHSARVGRHPA